MDERRLYGRHSDKIRDILRTARAKAAPPSNSRPGHEERMRAHTERVADYYAAHPEEAEADKHRIDAWVLRHRAWARVWRRLAELRAERRIAEQEERRWSDR